LPWGLWPHCLAVLSPTKDHHQDHHDRPTGTGKCHNFRHVAWICCSCHRRRSLVQHLHRRGAYGCHNHANVRVSLRPKDLLDFRRQVCRRCTLQRGTYLFSNDTRPVSAKRFRNTNFVASHHFGAIHNSQLQPPATAWSRRILDEHKNVLLLDLRNRR